MRFYGGRFDTSLKRKRRKASIPQGGGIVLRLRFRCYGNIKREAAGLSFRELIDFRTLYARNLTMSAGLRKNSNLSGVSSHKPVLYLALELGWTKWKLAFASGPAEKPRRREVEARDRPGLLVEIAAAKQKLGLPADCPVE